MSHRLDPLLRPRSIAVLGATRREGSVGSRTVQNLLRGRYPGRLYAVNPSYDEVHGVPCFPSLQDLPETVEHVILAVSDQRMGEAHRRPDIGVPADGDPVPDERTRRHHRAPADLGITPHHGTRLDDRALLDPRALMHHPTRCPR